MKKSRFVICGVLEKVSRRLIQYQISPTLLITLLTLLLLLAACHSIPTTTGEHQCPPMGYSRTEFAHMTPQEFDGLNDAKSAAMAMAMIGCLGDPDPAVRDGIVYTTYSRWLRKNHLADDTVRSLRTALLNELNHTVADSPGFRRPFAALALAEVARADRVTPLFTHQERHELVAAAAKYMRSIDDYRGYDEVEGWRHGVAHGADLIMQLSLNEAITKQQMIQMRTALSHQITPQSGHFYIYGEAERMARPILFMARRGAFSEHDWTRWFEQVGNPASFESWNDIWFSQQGLAQLHNIKAFAQVLYVNAAHSENPMIKSLLPGVTDLLKRLP